MARALRHIVFFCAFLFLGDVTASADIIGNGLFHSVTLEDGLPGESVARIRQSSDGRVWLATSAGVSLYDGKRLLNFKLREQMTAKPGSDAGYVLETDGQPVYVFDLCEDCDGTVYAATGRGIYRKRGVDRDFFRIFPEITRCECVLAAGGVLYAGNREGFYVCHGDEARLVTVGASRMGVENGVRDMVSDEDGAIWFLSRYALNRWSPDGNELTSVNLTDAMPKGAALSRLAISGDRFYVGTKNNGLYVCSPEASSVTPVAGVGNVVTSLNAVSTGEVAVSCDGAGAFLLDGETGRIVGSFNTKADSRHRLPADAVYCFTKDSRGVCWFGFYRYGMCHSYFTAPVFNCYSFGGFSTAGLSVRSFHISDGVKLIGTGDGIYYVDENAGTVRLIPPSSLGGSHIITSIARYAGLYWIGSYDAGLHILDPRDFSISRVPGEPLLVATSVSCFAESPDGRLWVGTGEGIFIMEGRRCTGHFTENNSRLGGGMVSSMLFDAGGNCWVGSQSLSLYIAATGIFESSNFPKGFFNGADGLSCVRGHDNLLYFSKQSRIWFTDTAMTDFGRLSLPPELEGKTCYGFLDDGRGYFWIASSDGLFRIGYGMETLQHFGYGEGMVCRHISSNGVKTDPQGDIWVGTSDGLMKLNPEELERWQRDGTGRVRLCGLRLGENLASPSDEDRMNSRKRVRVSWNLVSEKLSLRFFLQDYARPNDRIYQYRLGDGGDWKTAGDGEDVEFRNLSPGTHTLAVRLAGVPGTATVYEISVIPSFAFASELFLLLVAAYLLLGWHRYRRDTDVLLRERGEIETALMEAEKESEKLKESEALRESGEYGEMQGVGREKYSRVRLDADECVEIVARMKDYLEQSRRYTDPELKMSDIAEVLRLSSSRLSQIFSLHLKENYYEFINRYRLEEFKRLLAAEEYRKYTLTALSEMSGFRKSNFYSTFRRIEGMTPAEYLKKHNIKAG